MQPVCWKGGGEIWNWGREWCAWVYDGSYDQWTIRFAVDVDFEEGKTGISFRLHKEHVVILDTLQAVKEHRRLAWTMGQDDFRVISVSKPAQGPLRCRSRAFFFKVLSEEDGSGGKLAIPKLHRRSAHRTGSWSWKRKRLRRGRSLRIPSSMWLFRRHRAYYLVTVVEKQDDIESERVAHSNSTERLDGVIKLSWRPHVALRFLHARHKWGSSFWILWSLYSPGGLEFCCCSCWMTSYKNGSLTIDGLNGVLKQSTCRGPRWVLQSFGFSSLFLMLWSALFPLAPLPSANLTLFATDASKVACHSSFPCLNEILGRGTSFRIDY